MALSSAQAQAYLHAQRRLLEAVAIVYRRGTSETSITQCVVGSSGGAQVGGQGAVLVEKTRDYLVAAADLDLEPQAGDEIDQVIDGATVTFIVSDPGMGSEPCWRWSDEGRTTLRIHTKES